MKKFLGILLCLAMCSAGLGAFAGCGSDEVQGSVYSLQTAYDNGWLTEDDLLSIAYYHNHGRGLNEELMAEDYAPQPKNPEQLDEETPIGQSIRRAFWQDRLSEEGKEQFGFEDVFFDYYGSYDGSVAVGIGLNRDAVSEVVFDFAVEGVSFRMPYLSSYAGAVNLYIWRENSEPSEEHGPTSPDEDGSEMIFLRDWGFRSGVPENVITVHSEEEDAVFVCVAEKGEFWDRQQYCKQVELSSGELTCWHGEKIDSAERDYVKLYVRKGEKYIGYGLIGIVPDDDWYSCSAVVIESVLFGEEDRDKTLEQIEELIAASKTEYEASISAA